MDLHGPHHGAQKSTSTGTVDFKHFGFEIVVAYLGDFSHNQYLLIMQREI